MRSGSSTSQAVFNSEGFCLNFSLSSLRHPQVAFVSVAHLLNKGREHLPRTSAVRACKCGLFHAWLRISRMTVGGLALDDLWQSNEDGINAY